MDLSDCGARCRARTGVGEGRGARVPGRGEASAGLAALTLAVIQTGALGKLLNKPGLVV